MREGHLAGGFFSAMDNHGPVLWCVELAGDLRDVCVRRNGCIERSGDACDHQSANVDQGGSAFVHNGLGAVDHRDGIHLERGGPASSRGR
jgi:hypothetical protein